MALAGQSFANIAEKYAIELMLQHGSTVTGRAHAASDIDIAIRFRAGVLPDLALWAALSADLLALVATLNRAEDGTMVVPSEYLQVVVRK